LHIKLKRYKNKKSLSEIIEKRRLALEIKGCEPRHVSNKLGQVKRRLGLVAGAARHDDVARRVAPPRAHAVERRHAAVPALPRGRQLRPAVEALARVHERAEPAEAEPPALVAGSALAPRVAERAPRALLPRAVRIHERAHGLAPDILFVAVADRLVVCFRVIGAGRARPAARARHGVEVRCALHPSHCLHEAGAVDPPVAPREGRHNAPCGGAELVARPPAADLEAHPAQGEGVVGGVGVAPPVLADVLVGLEQVRGAAVGARGRLGQEGAALALGQQHALLVRVGLEAGLGARVVSRHLWCFLSSRDEKRQTR